MARLNEVPQPAGETLDALKRRFIRQNRELARVNSAQSVRIRNAESEVSRLLSENVSLREQVIKLHYEVENNIGAQSLDKVDGVKIKLENKLAELGDLLRELGQIKSNAAKQRPLRRKSSDGTSPKRSPNQRNWKNALTLSEVTGDADGRLPAIMEDKCYPRRTLDSEELLGIFADPTNLTESPELGPPPVAHFEEGDPIKFDARQGDVDIVASRVAEPSHPALSANLETRKKRRESFHQKESGLKKNDPLSENQRRSVEKATASGQSLKSGAKRKLNVRDEEDEPQVEADKDECRFSRKNAEPRPSQTADSQNQTKGREKAVSDKISDEGTQTSKERTKDVNGVGNFTARKALGPKSVNSDPQSPAKLKRAAAKDGMLEGKDELATRIRSRSQLKGKTVSNKPPKSSQEYSQDVPRIHPLPSTEPPPETPVPPGLDLFSPTTSEPSVARSELRDRDTPPPPELGQDTGTGSFGRASRRPRGSVSYAEPSLRDKMRRPTKELMDAVGAEERARQATINRKSSGTGLESMSGKQRVERATIKQEDQDDPVLVWKTNPVRDTQGYQPRQDVETSPLGKKAPMPAPELPTSVITDRKRRVSTMSKKDDERDLARPCSGAGSAIAALSAGSSRSKRREEDKRIQESLGEGVIDAGERTSIFDFTRSSPEDLDKNGNLHEEAEDEPAKPTRASRRHSTISASLDQGKQASITISRRNDRRAEIVSSVGNNEDDSAAAAVAAKAEYLRSAKSTVGLRLESGDEDALARGRGERAASRRRSMML